MYKILTFILIIFSICSICSQTEQDYFERMRLKRIDWKIKKIISCGGDCVDYFDEQGYHIKREVFDNFNSRTYTYIITHLPSGDLSADIDLGPEGKFTTTGSQALFYHTYFDPYNLIDQAILKIDDRNRLIEESYTGTDMEGVTETIKYFYEILVMYPSSSEFYYSDNKLLSRTKYLYNGKGMLIKEIYSGSDNNVITVFTYEFYE
jgi:hypothetical protein